MAYQDLQTFIAFLEKRGQLIRVREPVSAELEITEIADRLVKENGPAILFENVIDRDFPLVIGLFGTRERMALALGVHQLNDLGERIKNLLDLKLGGGLFGLLSNLPKLREVANLPPKKVRQAQCQEVIWRGDQIDLHKLPILKCWPEDGGPFITLPLVITNDPESGEMNMGMYRMQVFSKNSTGMHWQRHKTGAKHLEKAKKLGKKLEVAVALGGDPALIYAATAPLPAIPGLNEYALTGFLRSQRQEVVKGITVDLFVPANAEFILEGYVDPDEEFAIEGPFGDHTGFYTLQDLYPTFHLTAITMRKNPVYPATIVGRPPMEDAYLIEASERIFLVPAQMILPEIVDYSLPAVGIAHNLVNILIKKEYPGHAYKAANGLLGLGQMMFAKVIIVIDEKLDLSDTLSVLKLAFKYCIPDRDIAFTKGPIDVLDHSSRGFSFGSKLIIDGTKKWPEEEVKLEKPPIFSKNPAQSAKIVQQNRLDNLLFVSIKKTKAREGLEIGEFLAQNQENLRLMVIVDDDTDVFDINDTLWTLLNNIDPERDSMITNNILILDGTKKINEEGFERQWPKKITMDEK